MEDYEKLGVFYLGREYDLAKKSPKEGLILYDSKDLVTHGVCVGMTGSGKTDPSTEELQKISIRPAKKDILVRFVALAWLPYWQSQDGKLTTVWQ